MRGRSASPDFLCSLVAPARFLRLSLTKAAYTVASSAAYRKSGFSTGNAQFDSLRVIGAGYVAFGRLQPLPELGPCPYLAQAADQAATCRDEGSHKQDTLP